MMHKLWYTKNRFSFLLLPLTCVYLLFFHLHKLIYRLRIKKVFHAPVPVLCVGNITVGGTGKTPLTIALAKILLANGFRPGVISRGYKAKSKGFPQVVQPDSDALIVGDEPLLIYRKTLCPVVVSPKRSEAIGLLLRKFDCDIIIADDGLQHHALHRDLEIILVDGDRQFGNRYCLPAGPLRESTNRLLTTDFLLVNGGTNAMQTALERQFSVSCYKLQLSIGHIYNLADPSLIKEAAYFTSKKVYAVAGIGHPERFFNSLRSLGITFVKKVFPNHHAYRERDFSFCSNEDVILMTEKDAVKCQHFVNANYWVLPVTGELSVDFIEDFMTKIRLKAFHSA